DRDGWMVSVATRVVAGHRVGASRSASAFASPGAFSRHGLRIALVDALLAPGKRGIRARHLSRRSRDLDADLGARRQLVLPSAARALLLVAVDRARARSRPAPPAPTPRRWSHGRRGHRVLPSLPGDARVVAQRLVRRPTLHHAR